MFGIDESLLNRQIFATLSSSGIDNDMFFCFAFLFRNSIARLIIGRRRGVSSEKECTVKLTEGL
jgi:hypothetical protein